jgi:hypothetical protein
MKINWSVQYLRFTFKNQAIGTNSRVIRKKHREDWGTAIDKDRARFLGGLTACLVGIEAVDNCH